MMMDERGLSGFLRRLVVLAAMLCLSNTAAWAACSSYAFSGPVTSRISLNEYNYSGNYLELKVINPTILAETANLNGWVLSLYQKSGGSGFSRTDFNVKDGVTGASCPAGSPYLKFDVGSSLGNDSVVVLWSDSARTQEVDYFRVGQHDYPSFQETTCFSASELPAASAETPHQAALTGSSARKDLARGPDGTGTWIETPYNGSDQGTSCTSNDGVLALTKTVTTGASGVWVGQNAVFRLTARLDSRAGAQSSVSVTDLLPAGLSYVAPYTASTGTYNSSTGVWTIGSLAAGASATLDLTARATAPGAITNSGSIRSVDFPNDNVGAATATLNVLIPQLTVTASPSSVAVNGTTTFFVTVTNPSPTLAASAFSVSNLLDALGLSLVSATPSAGSYAAGVWSLGGLGVGASATLTVVAKVTQSGVWADSAQVTMNGYLGPVVSATVSATLATLDAWINADRTISTQIAGAGAGIALTIGSFDSSGAPAVYTGNIAVGLQYCTNVNRTSGGGISCGGTWLDIPGASTIASFAGTATITATTPTVSNAYEIVRVKLTPPSGVPIYASDWFAIRPASLTVAATDADWLTAGAARSLVGGLNIHKAGRPFSLGISTANSNYPGVLLSVSGLEPAVVLAPPVSSVAGAFSAGAWSATSGGMQSTSAAYSEVGNIPVTIEDRHFADIDVADSTAAQRYVTGSATLGRFVPDFLTTTVLPAPGCSNPFNYSGQPFKVEVRAFAYGAASPAQNYDKDAGFSKLVTLSDAGSVTGLTSNTIAASDFSKGVGTAATVTDTFASQQAVPATLTLRAVDSDNVSSERVLPDVSVQGTSEIRSGRLWIANAYGSELLPLPVPLQAQYYTSSGWLLNTADSCTSLLLPTTVAGLVFGSGNLSAGETTPSSNVTATPITSGNFTLGAGDAKFRLSKPGAGNNGYVDITVDAPAWLKFPWKGAGLGAISPTARATFGIYKTPLIYRRENY